MTSLVGVNLGCLFLGVVLPGFEPGMTEPKPVVLPLHHSTILIEAFGVGLYLHCLEGCHLPWN